MDPELPADVAGHRLERDRGLLDHSVVADAGDARRLGVVALRLRADHRAVQTARAAFVEHAEAVDQSVVADVVPAVRVAVVATDREDDGGRLGRRVVVERDGAVYVHGLDHAFGGPPARRAPACPIPRVTISG